MHKKIETKMKRSVGFGLPILLFIVLFGAIIYSYDPLEEISLLTYLIILSFVLFILFSIIDNCFVKIIFTKDMLIRRSLLINKTIKLAEITEARVLKYPHSVLIKTKDKSLGIGWEYESHQELIEMLIKELEKRHIPIIYKNNLW